MKARKAAGELRAEMRNKIPASHAERLISKYSNHPKLASELRNAKEKYPEADVRPILKTHIKQIDWSSIEPIDILTAGYPCQPFSHD